MNTILFVGEHPKTYDVRWHKHEHWELVYCTSGTGVFRFENGSVIRYNAGDLVAIPPREIHANASEDGFTNIHLTMGDPSFSYKTAFKIADGPRGALKFVFEQAKTYYMTDIKKKEIVLAPLGDLIVGYIVVFRSKTEFSEPVEMIRTGIICNYSRTDFSLERLIEGIEMNPDYLRKLFKKEMGISALEYLTSLRMKSAEKLLTAMWSNEYTITEIAHMCGYDDALYFSRVFKKYFGCAPSYYANSSGAVRDGGSDRTEISSGDWMGGE